MTKSNPFYKLKLDPEEQAIEDALEKGEYRSIDNLEKEKIKLSKAAKYTLSKNKNINLRLPEKTIIKLKAIAARDGLPYQTLASSVLHKFANRLTLS